MRPLRLFLTAALLTLCTPLTGIAFAQTSSQTAPSTVRPLLYAVIAPESENKTQPTSYLYFTLPFAKADFYPLTNEVSQAYKEADTIAVEADISDEQKNTAAAQALRYGKKDHLKKHLSPATWASLNKMLGKQAQQFQSDHAVSVAMGLRLSAAMDLNYQPELAADLHFIHAAQHNEKQVIEFDSIAARNQRLASLSNKEADAYLSATLKAYANGDLTKETGAIEQAWRAADLAALTAALTSAFNRDQGSQKIHALMITERNAEIAEQLQKQAGQGKKIFAILDVARLCGEKSILKHLHERGFQIRPVTP